MHTLYAPNRTNTLYYVCTSSHFVSLFIFHLLILRYKYFGVHIPFMQRSHETHHRDESCNRNTHCFFLLFELLWQQERQRDVSHGVPLSVNFLSLEWNCLTFSFAKLMCIRAIYRYFESQPVHYIWIFLTCLFWCRESTEKWNPR